MKKLTYSISKIAFIFLILSNGVLAANKLSLSCQILDPTTEQAKTVFAPGDDMLLTIVALGPNDDSHINQNKDQKVDFQISSSAKIAGVKFPFQFKNSFRVPLSKTIDTESKGFTVTPSRIISIPKGTPKGSKLTLQIKATISSVGSKTCKQSVFVE